MGLLLRIATETLAALARGNELPPLEWAHSGGEHPRDEVWAAAETGTVTGAGWVISRHDGGESWDFFLLDAEGEAVGLGFAESVAEAKRKIERERLARYR
jgi:hypothetical protein